MAFVCDAGTCWEAKSTSSIEGTGSRRSMSLAQHLACWLKMQQPGLHLKPGEQVTGWGTGQRVHTLLSILRDCPAALRRGAHRKGWGKLRGVRMAVILTGVGLAFGALGCGLTGSLLLCLLKAS